MTTKEKIQELERQIEELKKEFQKEEMEELFKSLLNGLEIVIYDDHQKSLFYEKNSEVFFELYQDLKKKYFYCDYYLVWNIFEVKYKLNYDEIQAFIKSMVEQHLKLSKVTPYPLLYLTDYR
jgi:DNA invertase Pin-like site-specific DNA recombinase